jgi:hypothetical protein
MWRDDCLASALQRIGPRASDASFGQRYDLDRALTRIVVDYEAPGAMLFLPTDHTLESLRHGSWVVGVLVRVPRAAITRSMPLNRNGPWLAAWTVLTQRATLRELLPLHGGEVAATARILQFSLHGC